MTLKNQSNNQIKVTKKTRFNQLILLVIVAFIPTKGIFSLFLRDILKNI